MRKTLIFLLVCVLLICSLTSAFADEIDEGIEMPLQAPISLSASPNSQGLKNIMLTLIGDYEPVVSDYTYTSSSSYQTVSHSITTTVDWPWIGSCAIFLCMLFCVMRIIGGVINQCKK